MRKVKTSLKRELIFHSRYFFGRTGRIRAVEVRPQKFRANFFRFGQISSIVQPKNLLIWENFAQIERNSPEIFGADSPISGEKNNYCVRLSPGVAVRSLHDIINDVSAILSATEFRSLQHFII
jgi:hypothetical protein